MSSPTSCSCCCTPPTCRRRRCWSARSRRPTVAGRSASCRRPASASEVVSVVGFPTELRWVDTLVTSLLVQLTSAMLAACPAGVSAVGVGVVAAQLHRRVRRGGRSSDSETDRAAAAAAARRGRGRVTRLARAGRRSGTPAPRRSRSCSRHAPRRSMTTSAAPPPHGCVRRGPPAAAPRAVDGQGRPAGRDASISRNGVGGRRRLGPGGDGSEHRRRTRADPVPRARCTGPSTWRSPDGGRRFRRFAELEAVRHRQWCSARGGSARSRSRRSRSRCCAARRGRRSPPRTSSDGR